MFLYVFSCKLREREQHHVFAQPGTFEFEYASRWKALDEMEKQQREQVDRKHPRSQRGNWRRNGSRKPPAPADAHVRPRYVLLITITIEVAS